MTTAPDGSAIMVEEQASFESDGLTLSAVIELPDGIKPDERRPAFIVLHGFGTSKDAANVTGPTRMLTGLGYVAMRFDMRGCGDSEGERCRVICLEEVEDLRNAVTFLARHRNVIADRIAVVGSSFGAAVALYAAGVDERIAGVISSGGWGNGERKFRGQHPGAEAWARFTDMLERGRQHLETTGESLMVERDMIVPIPQHLRANLAANSATHFPAETAQSMFDFRAEEVVGQIAPRPVLLLHSSVDSVTPTEESIELFKRAGQPKDLHLFAEIDHFMLAESNHRVLTLVREWLEEFFPVA